MDKNNADLSIIHKHLNHDNSLHFLHWTGFLMILLTTLCDEYIDQLKLSEQKKTVEYIISPTKRGRKK